MELHLCSTLRARSRVLAHRQPECDALELTAGNFPFFDDQEEMRYIPGGDDVPNLAITKRQRAHTFMLRKVLCLGFCKPDSVMLSLFILAVR